MVSGSEIASWHGFWSCSDCIEQDSDFTRTVEAGGEDNKNNKVSRRNLPCEEYAIEEETWKVMHQCASMSEGRELLMYLEGTKLDLEWMKKLKSASD